MNATLIKALLALVPVSMLVAGSILSMIKRRNVSAFLQVAGADCFLLVVFAHVCEALNLLGWMDWGSAHSAGHYLDLVSAVIGILLFPLGYLLDAARRRDL